MSLLYNILKMLGLKEEHLVFYPNFYSEAFIKGVRTQIYHAKLTYKPKKCPCCGHVCDHNVIKHGFKTSMIVLPKISNMNARLKLDKQRYLCRHCGKTFTLSTSIVDRNCFISNNTKMAIALDASDKISESDLAKKHNVSHCTVNRVINRYYKAYKPKFNSLPESLCFDEFKSVKAAEGAMSFVFCDASNGKLIDLVEDRKLASLISYFSRYERKVRLKVKYIVIDMYKPYIQLIQTLFPNAKIVIDKFHVIQLISRSLNKTRIQIMNKDKQNYNKLKRYWRLLLKDRANVDYKNYRKYYCFKEMMCEEDVLNHLLGTSDVLNDTYELYQDLLTCIKTQNIDKFLYILENYKTKYPNISEYMKTSMKTLISYKNYIINMMSTKYNNGFIEGIINKIKVIKRIAFGYRSFINFKSRIMITQGIAQLKKDLSYIA